MSVPHGTHSRYVYGCRCEDCTKAASQSVARSRKQRFAEPKDPNDPRHGTANFYGNHGCRCPKCTSAWAEDVKRGRHTRKRNSELARAAG